MNLESINILKNRFESKFLKKLLFFHNTLRYQHSSQQYIFQIIELPQDRNIMNYKASITHRVKRGKRDRANWIGSYLSNEKWNWDRRTRTWKFLAKQESNISSAFSFMIQHSIFYIAIQHFKSRFKRSYLKICVILDVNE